MRLTFLASCHSATSPLRLGISLLRPQVRGVGARLARCLCCRVLFLLFTRLQALLQPLWLCCIHMLHCARKHK